MVEEIKRYLAVGPLGILCAERQRLGRDEQNVFHLIQPNVM